jgi:hypothetical protein
MGRSNRETKKPKQPKKVVAVVAPILGQKSAPKGPMPKKR